VHCVIPSRLEYLSTRHRAARNYLARGCGNTCIGASGQLPCDAIQRIARLLDVVGCASQCPRRRSPCLNPVRRVRGRAGANSGRELRRLGSAPRLVRVGFRTLRDRSMAVSRFGLNTRRMVFWNVDSAPERGRYPAAHRGNRQVASHCLKEVMGGLIDACFNSRLSAAIGLRRTAAPLFPATNRHFFYE
jgi:hypothetical protein